MGQPIIQPSFAAGELSPSLWARVDLAKFHVGAALLRNFFVDYRGGASNRPGTMFVARCLPGINRLIPFEFSTVQTYALLFSDEKMRVIQDGGLVLEPSQAITSASNTDPVVLEISTHGNTDGDWVYVEAMQGMTELNGKTFIVDSASTDSFALLTLSGDPVDGTAFGVWTTGGTVSRVYTLDSPYEAEDLALLKYSQSADVMTLTHPDYTVQQLTRTDHDSWSFTTASFQPSVLAPSNLVCTASTDSGTSAIYNYVVTAVTSNGLKESRASSSASVSCSLMSTTIGAFVEMAWDAVTGSEFYNVYRQPEVADGEAAAGSLHGYIGSSLEENFTDANITPDFTRTPPLANNPFSDNRNPSCSTYFQGRQAFAAPTAEPQRIVMSRSGDFLNMDFSTPSRDNDSIDVTLVATQVNAIKHLVPLTVLVPLTSAGASDVPPILISNYGVFRVDAGDEGNVVTPSTIQARQQSANVLYVEDTGNGVRELNYDFLKNSYKADDITVLASHLFFSRFIKEWCWAEKPFKLVWAVRDDGLLLSLTYLKEQDVYAWAQHNTLGRFTSTCSIREGRESAVYLLAERLIDGEYVQYVERMASRQFENVEGAWFVDCGLSYPLDYPAAQVTPSALDGIATIADTNIVTGGSGYTAPVASVVDQSGTGSGASLTLNLTGGVITSVTIIDGGENYVQPVINITDSTGGGAVITPIVQKPITLTSAPGVFTGSDVGKIARLSGGMGEVTSVSSTTSATINLIRPLESLWPVESGSWTMTMPVTTVSGLDHLEGEEVAILADGNVLPMQTVTNGQITLQDASDAIVAGLPYSARIESLYLDIPGESPTVQGRRKKLSAVTVRVDRCRGLRCAVQYIDPVSRRVVQTDPVEIKERTTQPMGQPIGLYTGDERVVLQPAWTVQGQTVIEQVNPLPATVLGFMPEVSIGDN